MLINSLWNGPVVRDTYEYVIESGWCQAYSLMEIHTGEYRHAPHPTLQKIIHIHDSILKWKHFLCYGPFVQGIQRSPADSPHKGQWCEALMFSLICARLNSCVHSCEAGDLRCHCAHYDVTVNIYIEVYGRIYMANKNYTKCMIWIRILLYI